MDNHKKTRGSLNPAASVILADTMEQVISKSDKGTKNKPTDEANDTIPAPVSRDVPVHGTPNQQHSQQHGRQRTIQHSNTAGWKTQGAIAPSRHCSVPPTKSLPPVEDRITNPPSIHHHQNAEHAGNRRRQRCSGERKTHSFNSFISSAVRGCPGAAS